MQTLCTCEIQETIPHQSIIAVENKKSIVNNLVLFPKSIISFIFYIFVLYPYFPTSRCSLPMNRANPAARKCVLDVVPFSSTGYSRAICSFRSCSQSDQKHNRQGRFSQNHSSTFKKSHSQGGENIPPFPPKLLSVQPELLPLGLPRLWVTVC